MIFLVNYLISTVKREIKPKPVDKLTKFNTFSDLINEIKAFSPTNMPTVNQTLNINEEASALQDTDTESERYPFLN